MACHNELLSGHDREGNTVCMNGSFMKEAFLFNGAPGIVGIYSGFTGFSIPEALKQEIGNCNSKLQRIFRGTGSQNSGSWDILLHCNWATIPS